MRSQAGIRGAPRQFRRVLAASLRRERKTISRCEGAVSQHDRKRRWHIYTEACAAPTPTYVMNRRKFLLTSAAGTMTIPASEVSSPVTGSAAPAASTGGVAVLLVDTDRATARIDERI